MRLINLTIALSLSALLCFPSSFAAEAADKSAEQLVKLGDEFYLEEARFDPISNATGVGDGRYDDQLNISISPAERKKHFEKLHAIQNELGHLHRNGLSIEDALTYDVLDDELRESLGAESFPDHLLPITQMDAMPVILASYGSGQSDQPLKSVANYDAYLKRISRLSVWIDQAITNMRQGIKQGVVQPRSIVIPMLDQLKAINKPLEDNPFYQPIKNMPSSFSIKDRQRLKQRYQMAVEKKILPATKKLSQFVESQYLPASRSSDGYSVMPNGMKWYQQWVQFHTTTSMTPDEIHRLGLKEVVRIHTELAKLMPQLGYKGDPKDFLTWLRTDPRFLIFKTDTEILDAYRTLNKKIESKLPLLFGRIPKASLDIREEPELTRDTASDHYSLPAVDGSRPGVFWAVITDPASYNSSTMGSLFLHEGQPGHHFQLALQQELSLPEFRKRVQIDSYIEGWGLYAETLGHELGVYDDPALYAGNLRMEMMRAVRLVVDTGIHAKGWSHDQAVKYFMDNTGHTEAYARNQIERYIAWPGQALSYKIGALKIQELRERARQQLGNKFSLAAFHDAILLEGPLPLSVLDHYTNQWIQQQR